MKKSILVIAIVLLVTAIKAQNSSVYTNTGTVNTVPSSGDGILGVGTSIPQATLQVNGLPNEDHLFRVQSSGSTKFMIHKNGAISTGRYLNDMKNPADIAHFYNPDANSAFVRVEAKASNAYFIADGKDFGSGMIMENHGDAKTFMYWSPGNHGGGLAIDEMGTAGEEVFIANGNVGIGSYQVYDGYKLSVNGKIRAKEIQVRTDWADFVFEKDYQLMPLAEVADFIQDNKHLPGIPSAAEVEEDGVDLGEANKLLLQKIEELTLHLIEMDKKVKALEAAGTK